MQAICQFPELLRLICDRTGVRSTQLGKIICRADKTFINAEPADAEKIIKAFAQDKEWRFKYDEPRELRNSAGSRKGDRDEKGFSGSRKGDRDGKNNFPGRDKNEKHRNGKKKVKTHKPLREEFFKWIEESDQ